MEKLTRKQSCEVLFFGICDFQKGKNSRSPLLKKNNKRTSTVEKRWGRKKKGAGKSVHKKALTKGTVPKLAQVFSIDCSHNVLMAWAVAVCDRHYVSRGISVQGGQYSPFGEWGDAKVSSIVSLQLSPVPCQSCVIIGTSSAGTSTSIPHPSLLRGLITFHCYLAGPTSRARLFPHGSVTNSLCWLYTNDNCSNSREIPVFRWLSMAGVGDGDKSPGALLKHRKSTVLLLDTRAMPLLNHGNVYWAFVTSYLVAVIIEKYYEFMICNNLFRS